MKSYWETSKVEEVLSDYLRTKQGENEIQYIVTFDEYGISSHPNHLAVHRGVSAVFEKGLF